MDKHRERTRRDTDGGRDRGGKKRPESPRESHQTNLRTILDRKKRPDFLGLSRQRMDATASGSLA